MALDGLVRNAIKIAAAVTSSLQEDVKHEAWLYQKPSGEPKYAQPVYRKALVEQKVQMRQLANGSFTQIKATLTFLKEFEGNGAPGRTEPLDARDKLTLQDGTFGPIVNIEGLRNPSRSRPFFLIAHLGLMTT